MSCLDVRFILFIQGCNMWRRLIKILFFSLRNKGKKNKQQEE